MSHSRAARPLTAILPAAVLACMSVLISSDAAEAWCGKKGNDSQGKTAQGQGTRARLRADVAEALGVAAARTVGSVPEGADAASAAAWHLERANELTARGKASDAAAHYLQAVSLDPGLGAAWNNLGAMLRGIQEWTLARKLFKLAVELSPASGLAHYNLATVHENAGDLVEADAEYLLALELRPDLWDPKVNPMIIKNPRASAVLHTYHLKRPDAHIVLLDGAPPGKAASP